MPENQNIEWKESWRDEFLKIICGFANANGGVIKIGVADDGQIVGVKDSKRLLEDIPNKVRDILGIVVYVELDNIDGLEVININIEAYPTPISYKNQYYKRTGSTTLVLSSNDLNKFLLNKFGKTWDSVIVDNTSSNQLNNDAISLFKKYSKNVGRLEIVEADSITILDKLGVMEESKLKRSAILLFHPSPELFFSGAYIKIGFFQGPEIIYQDEIKGSLMHQVDKCMELLLTKYSKAYIRYEGIHRVEERLFSEEALREAVINAIVHRDYSMPYPIQIKVYDHKIVIWNDAELPVNWSTDNLINPHRSMPYNPEIAKVFFLAGHIESWGRGIEKMFDACLRRGIDKPTFSLNGNELVVEFIFSSPDKFDNQNVNVDNTLQDKILALVSENPKVTIKEMALVLEISTSAIDKAIKKLRVKEILVRIGSNKDGFWKIVKNISS